jgi:hypothetical protein
MSDSNNIEVDQFIGKITPEQADELRQRAKEQADARAIQHEHDYLSGKTGDGGSIPLASYVGVPPHLKDPRSFPTFMSRIRRGGRSRTIALANLLATIAEPLVVAVLWCIPTEWASHMLKTDDESGQKCRYIMQPLRRKMLALIDFLLGTGMLMLAVAIAVFLLRDVYINQRHSILSRVLVYAGIIRWMPAPDPSSRLLSSDRINLVQTPGEINFIQNTPILPITPDELETTFLTDVEMFSGTIDRVSLHTLQDRMQDLQAPSAEHVGIPRRVINANNDNDNGGSLLEWAQRLLDCNGILINPKTYDQSEKTAHVALPADNWLPQRTVPNVPTWIMVEHAVDERIGLKEMCTMRSQDAARYVEATRRWNK